MLSLISGYVTFTLSVFLVLGTVIFVLRPYIKSLIARQEPGPSPLEVVIINLYQLAVLFIILDGAVTVLPLIFLVSFTVMDKRTYFHDQGRLWSKLYLTILGIELEISGQENLPKGKAIFIQNIGSYLDGAATLALLPAYFRTVFLRHMIPESPISWIEDLLGYLALEPGELSKMNNDAHNIMKAIDEGESLLTFAEENKDRIAVFGGTAFFAIQAKVPVVPVYIQRTKSSYYGFLAPKLPSSIKVRVGKPIDLGSFADDKQGRASAAEKISRGLSDLAG